MTLRENPKLKMSVNLWCPWKMEKDSAVDGFMYQLWNGKDICRGDWHGKWKGDNLLFYIDPEDVHWKFETNGDFVLEHKFFGWWNSCCTWATRCTLTSNDGKVYFEASNDDGSKYLSAGCHVDWEQFCKIWNHGGVTPGWDWSKSNLPILMFNDDGALKYDPSAYTLTFKGQKSDITLTEEQFVNKAVIESISPFKTNFEQYWIWLLCRKDGWMKKITSWDEFNNLLPEPDKADVKVYKNKLHKGQQYDAVQHEARIDLKNGDYLYGVEGGDGGSKFIRYYLHYEGDMKDDFKAPLPIFNCDVYGAN